ncbi:MAG: PHP domain-containing protein [Ruminococcaceae bacterium]|jgi:hypothetical protein|nr:PHP domain-containing protein [Oscillospiraceae bacterium]
MTANGRGAGAPLTDLHTHSTASDGQYSPAELVSLAHARGVEVLALTDHDTTDGVAEARAAGEALGVRVIPGIELSAKGYHTFHILGYAFDPGAQPIAALCARMKERRGERDFIIRDYLREHGMPLELSEVRALAAGVTGRPHFAQAMVGRGYVASVREAFDRWLDTDELHARMDRGKPSARECVEAIRASGGRASLAHPYQIGVDDETLDAIVRELAGYGLDAIECYYPRFTPEQQKHYLQLAEKYHLHVTGGSDFHGERVKPDIQLAALPLDVEWLLREE